MTAQWFAAKVLPGRVSLAASSWWLTGTPPTLSAAVVLLSFQARAALFLAPKGIPSFRSLFDLAFFD
jgi:hypothetical protein